MSVHVPGPRVLKYKVDGTSAVVAVANIGEGQEGGWAIGFDPSAITKGSVPRQVPIGPGAEIKGKILQVVVTAVDVLTATNRLSAAVEISGGPEGRKTVEHPSIVGQDGDTAIFTTLVIFE